MASTFDENKKMNCQSWFKHIGIEKSNNYTVQFFSAHRNTKTSSKSDKSTDLSTTDQGNGQDTTLEEDELAEDADPDLHPLRSDWNELCLVRCDECDYLYAPQAYMWHKIVRHSKQQDSSLYQHRLYQKKPQSTSVPEHTDKRKAKNGNKNTTNKSNKKLVTDVSKNNNSKSNTVDKADETSGPGPGPGRKRRRRPIFSTKKKKQKIVLKNNEETSLQKVTESVIEVLENCEKTNLQIVTENSIEELENRLEENCQFNCILGNPIDAHGCSMQSDVSYCGNFSHKDLVSNQSTNSKATDFCKIKNNKFIFINANNLSPSKMGRSLNEGGTTSNSYTDFVSNDPASVNQNVNLEKFHNGTPPKRLNGLRKESVNCVETVKQDRSFRNENNSYLDGSQLSSRKRVRKTKPDVKLKSPQMKEKQKTALASPVYEQCLQTIKLEPIKIKKALFRINKVCKARTIEQFRTFSHLKHIGKNSPHQMRVSCSVNTGAKSACIKSWNKVPFRYQSRKCFYPLSGSLQAELGLVLTDSPYKTLRATLNQNELHPSHIQFNTAVHSPYQSAVANEELYDEGFTALETDSYDAQQNELLSSCDVNSPWNSGSKPDSGYMSDRVGPPTDDPQQMSTNEGSPISSSSESWDSNMDGHVKLALANDRELLDGRPVSTCEDKKINPIPKFKHQELVDDSSQIILLFQKDNYRKVNGIHREKNEGCENR